VWQISSIVHPTDFTEASGRAFAHALRIALTVKAMLTLLHVADAHAAEGWASFPHVRQTLAAWGLMDGKESPAAIQEKLGLTVRKVEMESQSPLDGVRHFLELHRVDLLVLATEGRHGVARVLHGSVAEAISRSTAAPTLFVPHKARGFVDPHRGELLLHKVLVPVDHEPNPAAAMGDIAVFVHSLTGADGEARLLHVGANPPRVQHPAEPHRLLPVAIRDGDPVEIINNVANEWPADLIVMPTAGHLGALDALRGSTTERVVRQAPCPVLAMPTERSRPVGDRV
jgi:nucleotide-binding universal stress UspA family protein